MFWSKSAVPSKAEGLVFLLTVMAKLAAAAAAAGTKASWLVEWYDGDESVSRSCRDWTWCGGSQTRSRN
eukprot:1572340-Rhodomonas_salina.1